MAGYGDKELCHVSHGILNTGKCDAERGVHAVGGL